jgi:hypothetical protein
MSFLRSLYVVSIALLVFAFMVFGVAAFPGPQIPDVSPEMQSAQQNPTDDQQQLQTEQLQKQQAFQEQVSVYNRVLSFVIIGAAVVLLAASILWLGRFPIIGEGVTLGAVFTLLYGLYSAYSVSAGLLTFIAVAVGLLILLGLVYWKFIRSQSELEWIPEQDQTPTPKQGESNRVGNGGEKE